MQMEGGGGVSSVKVLLALKDLAKRFSDRASAAPGFFQPLIGSLEMLFHLLGIRQSYTRDKDRESATRFDRMLFVNFYWEPRSPGRCKCRLLRRVFLYVCWYRYYITTLIKRHLPSLVTWGSQKASTRNIWQCFVRELDYHAPNNLYQARRITRLEVFISIYRYIKKKTRFIS